MISNEQKRVIIEKLAYFKPKKLGVFGSYARGENTNLSDLDLLVKFGIRISLLDLIKLEQDLSESLGVKVDLVTEGALSQYIKPHIEKDFQSILNEG